jgi:8-oxo-dGTP pyrophosphatase MutT (NUDIX family)
LHPRVGLWLQVGGHCEPGDNTLLDAAAREAREESGIGSLSFDPTPIGLDVHPITCSLGVPTRHFDVRFVAVAPDGAEPVRSDESLDLRWFPVGELPPDVSPDLPPLIDEVCRRMGL